MVRPCRAAEVANEMTRRKHKKTIKPTGDASLWFSRLSGDEPTATWYDITVNGNNGTANNAGVCLANYYFRGGNLGSGTDDFVTTAYAGNIITATQPWSLEGWVVRDPADPAQVTIWGTRKQGPNGGWLHRENNAAASGPIDFDSFVAAGNPKIEDVIPDVLLQGWSHIAVTWTPGDGVPGTADHYYNGVLSDSSQISQDFDNGDIFEIAGSTFNRWTGFIDTVRVFSRVLSADEILRDYNAGKPAHP